MFPHPLRATSKSLHEQPATHYCLSLALRGAGYPWLAVSLIRTGDRGGQRQVRGAGAPRTLTSQLRIYMKARMHMYTFYVRAYMASKHV